MHGIASSTDRLSCRSYMYKNYAQSLSGFVDGTV